MGKNAADCCKIKLSMSKYGSHSVLVLTMGGRIGRDRGEDVISEATPLHSATKYPLSKNPRWPCICKGGCDLSNDRIRVLFLSDFPHFIFGPLIRFASLHFQRRKILWLFRHERSFLLLLISCDYSWQKWIFFFNQASIIIGRLISE